MHKAPTIVISHPSAEIYAGLIESRFPDVRVLQASDASSLERYIAEAEILLTYRFPVEVLDKATKLRWVQFTGAGVDSLFPIRDRVNHITVTNARGIHGEVIADYVMAGVTFLHWNFRSLLEEQIKKSWKPRPISPLTEKTIGIIGLGSIGATIARRAKSTGMTVLGSKRDISVKVDGVDELFAPQATAEMLPRCDFVVLALPATSDTLGLFGPAEIAGMRPDAYLINIARGSVVVEAELIKALQNEGIAGAMLDVFEQEPLPPTNPLWTLPNVIVTPHMAGNPANYESRAFSVFAENLTRLMEGQGLKNIVDLQRGY
ncbi:hydroxyacid dehydrogenase [Rhizobium esperanzae]|uniref:Hydroxyacid dehydrogenase n=1 Tax=Rhizobium esperanzae TaxID=1967781 RepID=A0A246DKR6_9HYPH|nr:D-2-hydroxyacid dehydrogenase [Rhizobium esperanzae]OWO89559.1 hydroxyacid dehydrogenase [Rhizobium esperanzae]